MTTRESDNPLFFFAAQNLPRKFSGNAIAKRLKNSSTLVFDTRKSHWWCNTDSRSRSDSCFNFKDLKQKVCFTATLPFLYQHASSLRLSVRTTQECQTWSKPSWLGPFLCAECLPGQRMKTNANLTFFFESTGVISRSYLNQYRLLSYFSSGSLLNKSSGPAHPTLNPTLHSNNASTTLAPHTPSSRQSHRLSKPFTDHQSTISGSKLAGKPWPRLL